ncbi:MAG: sigma-70 family RNA polymerase sigma factor, partial [Gammaproteobacteria bacterium]
MTRYRKGDEKAFELLYGRHKGPLYRFLQQRCFDAETANDVFQEVWTKVIRARLTYEPTAKFTTWLYQLARNTYVDHVRHVQRRIRLVSDNDATDNTASAQPNIVDQVQGDQLQEALDSALRDLPAEQKEAFLLHQEVGLTLPEIAHVTEVGRETVKSR